MRVLMARWRKRTANERPDMNSAARPRRSVQDRIGQRDASRPPAPKPFSYYGTGRSRQRSDPLASRQERDRAALLAGPSLRERGKWHMRAFRMIGTTLGMMLLVGWLFWLDSTSVVVVANTASSGTTARAPENYRRTVDRVLGSNFTNHFKPLVSAESIREVIRKQYPEVETARVSVPIIGNDLKVIVQVSRNDIELTTSDRRYILSSTGYIIGTMQPAAAAAASSHPVIKILDLSRGTPAQGQQYLPGSIISFIREIDHQLKAQHLKPAQYILPSDNAFEVMVRLEGTEYNIRFNTQEDPVRQSGAAAALVQNKSVHAKEYIDVRVPGKGYWR